MLRYMWILSELLSLHYLTDLVSFGTLMPLCISMDKIVITNNAIISSTVEWGMIILKNLAFWSSRDTFGEKCPLSSLKFGYN